jgi:hypothetical protein
MSREEFESFLREKAGEIMNKAADKLFDELADKVAGEKEEDGLEAAGNEGMSKMKKEGERQKEIQRAAAVPEAKIVQVRVSPRLQKSGEHVLAKAQERAAKRNLEFDGGNSHYISPFTVNRDIALDCLQQIGIDVGDNSDDKISCVQNLLACELEREDVEFDGLEQVGFDSDSDDDNFEMFELKALKSLCGEMMEEVFDESSFPLSSELDDYKRKGKSHAKSCLGRTCRNRGIKVSKRCAK